MKKILLCMLSAMLCLTLTLSAASAETRQGVIWLEGMEEIIEETRFDSPLGFSFWYANECLEAYPGEADGLEGVVVDTIWSDDYMVLSVIAEDEAEALAAEYGLTLEESEERTQTDLCLELKDGTYRFCSLIAEGGQYLRADGRYMQEAAEGNAKYFQRVLDSVTFEAGCPLRAEWASESADEAGRAGVILTAREAVTDVRLLRLDWDGVTVTWEDGETLGSFAAGESVSLTLSFTGDMPENGVRYTDAAGDVHAYALDMSGEDGSLYFWDLAD